MTEQHKLPFSSDVLKDLEELKKTPPDLGKQRVAKANGKTEDSALVSSAESSASNTVAFNIGTEVIRIPEMTWDIIEELMPMFERENQPDPSARWYHTKVRDFEAFLKISRNVRPDLTMEYLKSRLTLKQANELSGKIIDVLELSGFVMPKAGEVGEDSATGSDKTANGSTETLTVSLQDLSEEDAQTLLTGTKSNE